MPPVPLPAAWPDGEPVPGAVPVEAAGAEPPLLPPEAVRGPGEATALCPEARAAGPDVGVTEGVPGEAGVVDRHRCRVSGIRRRNDRGGRYGTGISARGGAAGFAPNGCDGGIAVLADLAGACRRGAQGEQDEQRPGLECAALTSHQNVALHPCCGVVHRLLVQQAETPTTRGPERLPGPKVGGGR